MEKFVIETHGGDDYITFGEHGFTLLVIPPGKQPYSYELGRQVVGADFIGLDEHDQPGFDSHINYDFEGINFSYFDDDSEKCNKELWFETIEYY